MIVLEIDNSYSRVKGLTTNQFRALRKILSYQTDPKAAYYTGGFTRTIHLMDKAGSFPTGLAREAARYLNDHNLEFKLVFKNKRPKSSPGKFKFDLKDIVPYSEQERARLRCGVMNRGGIVMPTGTGKSLVIAMLIATKCVKTLVVVPTLEIKRQLSATLEHHFGKNKYIRVENIDSKELQTLTDFDMLIIDECHHAAAKTYQKLNKTAWKNIYYRYFFTATFYRNNESDNMVFRAICGYPIFKLEYKQAVRQKMIVPVEAYYVNIPKTETNGHNWNAVYNDLVVNKHIRNLIIANLLLSFSDVSPTLCLVKEIDHGNILSELTGIPFVNGQDEHSRSYIRQFNSGGIMAVIGTTGILGEGVDTKPAEYIVIAGLGKAKSAFQQQVGRGVRNYPGKSSCKVILFNDLSHKWTKAHFKTQYAILVDEYEVKPVELSI